MYSQTERKYCDRSCFFSFSSLRRRRSVFHTRSSGSTQCNAGARQVPPQKRNLITFVSLKWNHIIQARSGFEKGTHNKGSFSRYSKNKITINLLCYIFAKSQYVYISDSVNTSQSKKFQPPKHLKLYLKTF